MREKDIIFHNISKLVTLKYTMSTLKVIKYIGRTTDFKGKSLWEIVGRLKNYGVGRIVVRSMFERYPEPSFMKILKVETCPDEETRKVRVWVEKTFRGKKIQKVTEIHSASYKTDYRLLSKKEEATYTQVEKEHDFPEVILPRTIEMPPLMKEFIIAENKRKGLKINDLLLPIKYHTSPNRVTRIALEGETPTLTFTMGLGKPVSPSLYEGVDLNSTK